RALAPRRRPLLGAGRREAGARRAGRAGDASRPHEPGRRDRFRRGRRPGGLADREPGRGGRGPSHGRPGVAGRADGGRRVSTQPLAFINARMVDPESGYDGPGCLLARDGLIVETARRPAFGDRPSEARLIDCEGAVLAPGLVDLRVKTGEPGAETRETLKSAAEAAAAGGVTTLVLQPDTDPPVDEPALVDFLTRRARDLQSVRMLA